MIIEETEARAFAEEWLAGWNDHDLDRILSRYAADIVFFSPVAEQRIGSGRVAGIDKLRRYWAAWLEAEPGLKFELTDVLSGFRCLTILCRNHQGQAVAVTLEFQEDGKVVRGFACYA
jgi:hypothetical protein